jgi:hypothetical protein
LQQSFLSIDPIEELIGKLTVDMTDWDLIAYLKHAMMALYGFDMPVQGRAEPSIMQCLQSTYGQQDAGLIIKWVRWKYDLRDCANPGQYIKFTSFAKGRRWWTDMMHAEMSQQMAAELAAPSDTQNSALWLLER